MKKNTIMFKGKAIYNPSGKAGEYSYWACNFYKGCSNGCTYCYLKKGVLAHAMGRDKPELKACFKDEANALEVFEKELLHNLDELRKHGLFFSFTTDPLLRTTRRLTWKAVEICMDNNVPVKLLTKVGFSTWMDTPVFFKKDLVAFGFTLTGHDELEPNASTNAERIEAMKKLHEAGFKTWASIEPIIDFESSKRMIQQSTYFCDLYKIGLESGKKYDKQETNLFMLSCLNSCVPNNNKIYFKDSFLKQAGINREDLHENCVTRKYNIFTRGDECLEECTSCDKKFDIEDMESDSEGNWFCKECWKELEPVMKAEYVELKAKEEIDS